MKNILTTVIAAALFALVGCSRTDAPPQQTAESAVDAAAPAMSESRPVEGTSFRGEPLYRQPVPEERLAELTSQIEVIEARPALSEDDYIKLGQLYIASNRFRDSIDLYTRGLQAHPESFKLRRHRGHRYINLRQLDKAIADLREAVDLIGDEHNDVLEYSMDGEPTATYEHWVWYHIGLYHYLNEEWDEAAAGYQKCVDTAISNGNLVGATDWLYNALMKGGRSEDAEAALARIPVDMDTNRNHPYFKRVMVYKGEIDPADVIDIDKPVADWTGFDITAGYGIGNWYGFNGDSETAERIHSKILQTPYWNAWAYVVTDREFSRR